MTESAKDKLIFFLLGMLVGIGCTVFGGLKAYKIVKGIRSGGDSSAVSSVRQEPAPKRSDFALSYEDAGDLKMLQPNGGAQAKIVSNHATDGKNALMVTLPSGTQYPGILWEVYGRGVQNWSGAENFHADIFNNSEQFVDMVVKFKSGKDDPKKSFEYPVQLQPLTMNTISIPLQTIKNMVNVKEMSYVKFFVQKPGTNITLYFDNIGTK